MKRIKTLHEQHNKFPELKHMHLSYAYDPLIDDWKFLGYRCMKCGTIFKREGTIPNHQKSCKEFKSVRKEVKIEGKIVDVNGNEWKPLDSNQN